MSPPRVALATAIAAFDRDPDLAPLQDALAARGALAEVLAWDDSSVSWSRFDLVVLRSTWDYMDRLQAFLAWCARVHAASSLLNPPDVVRWNTDKHYLAHFASAGVPVPACRFLEPGAKAAAVAAALDGLGECVVKPAVGAGSRGAQRFSTAQRDAAVAHAQHLLGEGRSVLVQPYLAGVDQAGETGLIFLGGRFSHAIRKGPLLAPGAAASTALFLPSRIEPRVPAAAELAVARQVLAALPFGHPPPYARVDLLPSDHGPQLLEIELTEPSLFFAHGPGSAERFAEVLLADLASRAPAARSRSR